VTKANLNELLNVGAAIWALVFAAYFISFSVYFWLDIDKPYLERREPAWVAVLMWAAYSPILVPLFVRQFIFTYLIGWPLVGAYRGVGPCSNLGSEPKQ
jgi:hypothetical protein